MEYLVAVRAHHAIGFPRPERPRALDNEMIAWARVQAGMEFPLVIPDNFVQGWNSYYFLTANDHFNPDGHANFVWSVIILGVQMIAMILYQE